MDLKISGLLACCVILLPLVAQLKSRKPATLFLIVATVYAIFGAVNAYVIWQPYGEPLFNRSRLNDTYYIVSGFHYYISMAVLLLISAMLLWVQQKLKAMLFPNVTGALFWVFNLGVLAAIILPKIQIALVSPKQLPENLDSFRALNLIAAWSAFIAPVALLILILLFFTSIVLRLKRSR